MRKPLQRLETLSTEIDAMRSDADGREILTRSQQQLQAAQAALADYQVERKAIRADIRKTRSNLVKLTQLLDVLEGQEADLEVLHKAELDRVHALQSAGVSLE